MKIKSVVAVGAMGFGMGVAGLVGGTGVASAAPCDDPIGATPPLTPARVACVTNEQIGEFLRTASPQYNIDVFLNGTAEDPSLGLVNQPATFVDSLVGDDGFFDGPRSPDFAPPSANEPAGGF